MKKPAFLLVCLIIGATIGMVGHFAGVKIPFWFVLLVTFGFMVMGGLAEQLSDKK